MTLYIKASDCSNGVIPSMNLSEMICYAIVYSVILDPISRSIESTIR